MAIIERAGALRALIPDDLPYAMIGITATILIGVFYTLLTRERPLSLSRFPLMSVEGLDPESSWLLKSKEVIAEADKKTPQNPFQVMTGTGPKIILPNKYVDEIRNNPHLDFAAALRKDFFPNYPGFNAFGQGLSGNNIILDTVRVKLTQSLNLVTQDLVDETTASLHDIYGEENEWKQVVLKTTVLDLVARLSSRVFLGLPLCRDRRWLNVSINYTVTAFMAAMDMRAMSSVTRPIQYWFNKNCAELRKLVADANSLIGEEVDRRVNKAKETLARGEKPQKTADAIGWLHEVAQGRAVDYVSSQLSLSLAAIHTTTEATTQALLDVCNYPEVVPDLRKEIIDVIGEHGWAKTTLYKLKLMDSFLKESQRVSPRPMTGMSRYVNKTVELSDGTILPKGARLELRTNFSNPDVYAEPNTFDAARFLKMRARPGQENHWQFVTLSSDYTLFGHGTHACPGRFFATNEIKIALCHLLLKYDWRFNPEEERPKTLQFEARIGNDPTAKVQFRRRKEELDLDLVL